MFVRQRIDNENEMEYKLVIKENEIQTFVIR